MSRAIDINARVFVASQSKNAGALPHHAGTCNRSDDACTGLVNTAAAYYANAKPLDICHPHRENASYAFLQGRRLVSPGYSRELIADALTAEAIGIPISNASGAARRTQILLSKRLMP